MQHALIPTIETERLILSAHTPDDFIPLKTMWNNEAIYRFISNKTSTEHQCWMRMLSYQGLWSLLGFGYWAVREKATGEYIGDIGFADFYREMTPSTKGIPEAGWVIAPHAHGKGYATEALNAAINWLKKQPFQSKCICIIDPDNVASLNVAEKVGFEFIEERECDDSRVRYFEIKW